MASGEHLIGPLWHVVMRDAGLGGASWSLSSRALLMLLCAEILVLFLYMWWDGLSLHTGLVHEVKSQTWLFSSKC